MRKRIPVLFTLMVLFASVPMPAHGYEFNLGKHIEVFLKGDVTYTLRVRTENQDPNLVRIAAGDWNFEKGDLVNNKIIGRLELTAYANQLSLFFRGEAFYDDVFRDKDKFEELARKFGPSPDYGYDFDQAERHALYNFSDSLEYYLEGNFDDFTFRLGRQVVNWGESIAPVFAVAVNTVSPFFGAKVAAAGYTFRDYQVPTLIAWGSYEATPTLSFEAVWQPDFDPRYSMPVVGTFASFTNSLGFGQDSALDEQRPDDFEDQQQGGVAIRKRFPKLKNLELGLYYYHHLSREPAITLDLKTMIQPVVTYGHVDMVGMSFASALDSIGLQIQGELAYRPNDILQKNLVIHSPFLAWNLGLKTGESYGPAGGFDTGQTLNWVFGGSRLFSNVLGFTPWIVSLTTMYEFYGGINLDYEKNKNYSNPQFRAYYFVALPFVTADMIDNTTVTLQFDATGTLHPEQDSLQRFSGTLKAKWGDHLEGLVGYDYIRGRWQENIGPNNMSDRDQFTFTLTYYFI